MVFRSSILVFGIVLSSLLTSCDFSGLRFDGHAISSLQKDSDGGLIPITSPAAAAASKLTTPPTILRRGKRRKTVSFIYYTLLYSD